jgi:hypothetical protein
VVQVWGRQSRLLQFYTRIDPTSQQQMRQQIEQASRELLDLLGGKVAGSAPGHERLARWTTLDTWSYFHHVSANDIANEFFSDLDKMQGEGHTYYTGGAATFEMVEAIVRHAKYIVEKMHGQLQDAAFPRPRPVPFRTLAPPQAETEVLRPLPPS